MDHAKNNTYEMELLADIHTIKDFPLVVVINGSVTGLQWWILYGKERAGLTMAGGCTGEGATQMYPFLQSGQLIGLVAGIKGGAEYETLLNDPRVSDPGPATRRMVPQSMGHLVIILFVLIGNFAFIMLNRKRKEHLRND